MKGVGDAEFQAAGFGSDEGIGVSEAAKFDAELGKWGAGPNLAEDPAADFGG